MARIDVEKARGTADMQGQLASSQVSVDINHNQANARAEQARGEAAYVETVARADAARVEVLGQAEATKIEAIGLADATRAEAVGLAQAKAIEAQGVATAQGLEAQKEALGEGATALVNAIKAIAEGQIKIMPDVLVSGGGGSVEGFAASLIKMFRDRGAVAIEAPDAA
jgi:hypothetical protein